MVKPGRYILFLLIWLGLFLNGSQAQNPFDFANRLPKSKQDSLISLTTKSFNPFDIPNKREVKKRLQLTGPTHEKTVKSLQFNKQAIPQENLFWVNFSVIFFIAFISAISRSVFKKIMDSLFNFKKLKIFQREVVNFFLVPMVLLSVFWIFNLSLFLYFLCHYYSIELFDGSLSSQIFKTFGCVLVIFCIKHLLWFFVSRVFPIQKEMDQFQFSVVNFHIAVGLFLLPINLILCYIPVNFIQFFLVLGIILVSSIFMFRAITGLILGSKYIFAANFHFLLYLCTIEIAPFLVLLKLIIVLTGF